MVVFYSMFITFVMITVLKGMVVNSSALNNITNATH